MNREPQLILVGGAPGYGKSTFTEDRVIKSKYSNALIYVEEEDILNGAYRRFPVVDFYKYRGGKVRINAASIDYTEFLTQVETHFINGVLIIDEGGIHEKRVLTPAMDRLQRKRRKKGLDMILNYHGVSDMPVGQFKLINSLVLFHTGDEFSAKMNVPKRKELLEAQTRIREQVLKGNKYYGERIWFS